MTVRAAGCVVARRGPQPTFLVAHRPRYDDWSFAKGKVDPGEDEPQTAVREVEEETGLRGQLGAELTAVSYVDHKDRPKVVRYWLMVDPEGDFVANDEVDEVRWLAESDAAALLTYARDRELLAEASRLLSS